MKWLVLISLSLFSVTTFAISDADFKDTIAKASVMTDLYFCFKGQSGAKLSDDKVIDQLIMKNCDQRLEDAIKLNISEEEILNLARRVNEENKKSEFELILEQARP